jgi:Domain of unknown function (DUF4832)
MRRIELVGLSRHGERWHLLALFIAACSTNDPAGDVTIPGGETQPPVDVGADGGTGGGAPGLDSGSSAADGATVPPGPPSPYAEVTVVPAVSDQAFRNPLKGFRPDLGDSHPYGATLRQYVKWNDIENNASDGVDKIRSYSNAKWKDLPATGAKVIPRVYLDFPGVGTYWPADMSTGDFTSNQFKQRALKMIAKLGEAWDNDPRVAFVQTGILGKWGEQHSPSPDVAMQTLIGDAFKAAFKNKLLINRYPTAFQNYGWGIYWDSFGCEENVALKALGPRWKSQPMDGEIAYDFCKPAGDSPLADVSSAANYEKIMGLVRDFHTTDLGWIASAPYNNSTAAGIDALQKTFGYRYVINEARLPSRVDPGQSFSVNLRVTNTGSAPFYYQWPIEIALLDEATRKPVWKQTSTAVDIRTWIAGDGWNAASKAYSSPAPSIASSIRVSLPATLASGRYVLTVAIVDPAGMQPAVRFATRNYVKGGRHPLGRVAVGTAVTDSTLSGFAFDDLKVDAALPYAAP